MERIDKKPLWRKMTSGKLYLHRKPFVPIKPKQKVLATEEELGNHVKDFELLDKGSGRYEFKPKKVEKPEEEKPVEGAEKEVYMVEHVGTGWYNVLSPAGKVMNESKLRSEDAQALRAKLEEETIED